MSFCIRWEWTGATWWPFAWMWAMEKNCLPEKRPTAHGGTVVLAARSTSRASQRYLQRLRTFLLKPMVLSLESPRQRCCTRNDHWLESHQKDDISNTKMERILINPPNMRAFGPKRPQPNHRVVGALCRSGELSYEQSRQVR